MKSLILAFATVSLLLLLAVITSATPTTPVHEHAGSWPKYHLVMRRDGNGKLLRHLLLDQQQSSSSSSSDPYKVIPASTDLASGEVIVATARYNPAVHTRGWNFLKIETDVFEGNKNNLTEEYYRSGYIEGHVTYDAMYAKLRPGTWARNIETKGANFTNFLVEHIDYMKTNAAKYRNSKNSADANAKFWARVDAIISQMQGIADGYSKVASAKKTPAASFLDIFATNFAEEIGDVKAYFNATNQKLLENDDDDNDEQNGGKMPYKMLLSEDGSDAATSSGLGHRPQHCSALIRITQDDLYASHDSWSTFDSMLRLYKIYQFSDATVQLSSYSGRVFSLDDWLLTSRGLSIMETTLVVFNTELYKSLKPQCVSEFIRIMVASYLSHGGKEFGDYFLRENSFTYNNEYMVTDFKKFTPGQNASDLPDELLWVVDQVPGDGNSFSGDATSVLRKQSYFPSYNTPWNRDAFVLLGYETRVVQIGSVWSYEHQPRAEIFRRNATTVHSLEHFQRLMRYDNFKHDPLSLIPNCSGATNNECDPPYSSEFTIACRGDLNPPGKQERYGPAWGMLGLRDHAAIDAKIAIWSKWKQNQTLVISGPTNDQQPTFVFTKSPFPQWKNKAPPAGMPDTWNFPWVQVHSDSSSGSSDDDENATGKAVGVIFGVVAGLTVIGLFWMQCIGSSSSSGAEGEQGLLDADQRSLQQAPNTNKNTSVANSIAMQSQHPADV